MALTAKQQAFVNEYITCWNASEAARRAGYSEATASEQGSRLLGNANVSDEIKRRVSEMSMTADEVLIRLAEIARGTMADYLEFKDGIDRPYINIHKAADAGKLGLLKKFKYTPEGTMEFELHDPITALIQLGKVHKLFTEKSEVSGIDGGPVVIKVIYDDAKAEPGE